MLASPVWCNCVIALRCCFSVVFGKKSGSHTNTNYINLPLFLSESSLYRWPVFATTKPIGPGVAANPMMAMMMSNPMMAMMMGVQARVVDECWSIGSQFRSKGMHGTSGYCHHSYDLDLHPTSNKQDYYIFGRESLQTLVCHCYWVWALRLARSVQAWQLRQRVRRNQKRKNWFAWGPRG